MKRHVLKRDVIRQKADVRHRLRFVGDAESSEDFSADGACAGLTEPRRGEIPDGCGHGFEGVLRALKFVISEAKLYPAQAVCPMIR